jgi:hypothetical protein
MRRTPSEVCLPRIINTASMNSKTSRKHLTLLAVLVAANLAVSLLPGCRSKQTVQTQGASVGQQLQDLDKAYKDGTINQKEYERLKKAIIKKND